MGKRIHLQKIEELFRKSAVVSYSSIARIIRDRRGKSMYAKQLIRNLIRQDKIQQLTKGYYTTRNNASLLVFCLQQAYLGLQDALSVHGLWEQETIPVIITTRKVRQGIRTVLGMNVLVRRIQRGYCFGIVYVQDGELYLPYSDVEKTLIDMVYFKENIDDSVLRAIKKMLDKSKLNTYLKRYPPSLRNRVEKLVHG